MAAKNGARAALRIHQLTRLLLATGTSIGVGALTSADTDALLMLGQQLIDRIVQGARGDTGGGLSIITDETRTALADARSALGAWTPGSAPKLALDPINRAAALLLPHDVEA